MHRVRCLTAVLGVTALLMIGCGAGGSPPQNAAGRFDVAAAQREVKFAEPGGKADAAKPEPGKEAVALPRKIVYTGEVEVIVEDFDPAQKKLLQLIQEIDGAFIAQSDLSGSPGSPRRGRWKVRVPVGRLDKFVAAVEGLGELQRSSLDSKDVTEEFYDLEARIKNKKIEEERLIGHLKNSTGKLEEILAVEREISRVRGEIEQQQGRLQLLANLTSLTTLTINMYERKDYVRAADPGFGTSVGRTFSGSLEMLTKFGRGVVLVVVALVPWLPVLVLVIGMPYWLLRRWLRGMRATPLAEVQPAEAAPAG
jgi:hypothetical protein